jgi:hypothetical protein
MTNVRMSIVLALLALAGAVVPGPALATSTTVQGEVTSRAGSAVLEGAQVVVMDRNGAGPADDKAAAPIGPRSAVR